MDNSSFLNFLSVIISAFLTAAGAVLAAYINKGGAQKAESTRDKILTPPSYKPSSSSMLRAFGIKQLLIMLLSLIVLTLFARWLLSIYFSDIIEIQFASRSNPTLLNPN